MIVECETSSGKRRLLNVTFNIKRSMVDGKLRGIITGRSGAHCFNCDWEVQDYWKPNPGRAPLPVVRFDH